MVAEAKLGSRWTGADIRPDCCGSRDRRAQLATTAAVGEMESLGGIMKRTRPAILRGDMERFVLAGVVGMRVTGSLFTSCLRWRNL